MNEFPIRTVPGKVLSPPPEESFLGAPVLLSNAYLFVVIACSVKSITTYPLHGRGHFAAITGH